MAAVLGVILLLYCWLITKNRAAWQAIKVPDTHPGQPSETVAVVVAMRNEEHNVLGLLNALAAQQYPRELFSIILVNDHSTDATATACHIAVQQISLPNLELINLADISAETGKKAALAAGIARAGTRYICTTDADCQMGPGWLAAMVAEAVQHNAVLVSGPVQFTPAHGLFGQLQAVEFAGLIAIGAASIQQQKPTMCNGANLLFEKEAFEYVGGYTGNMQVASGDDEFLLHKIAVAFPGRYRFLKSKQAIVNTPPSANFTSLLNQRIRWASKWKHYTTATPKWLALAVTAMHISLLAGVAAAMAGFIPVSALVLVICVKFAFELFFFRPVLRFFGMTKLWWLVALLQLLYTPFVVAVALASLSGKYTWKGRKIYPQ